MVEVSVIKRFFRLLLAAGITLLALLLAVNAFVYLPGRAAIVPLEEARPAQVAIVLGAQVFPDGRVSAMVADRLATAYDLYKAGQVKKILVTGDHGTPQYDEVNTMRRHLEEMGVPTQDIFMDHAGFDTYNSMYRARAIFEVQSAVVVTQRFHLPRALWLAQRMGIHAQGVVADRRLYGRSWYYEIREFATRVKAFGEVLIRAKPTFLGPAIPITGDGRQTHDQAQ